MAKKKSSPDWEYASAPETTAVNIAKRYDHFINGKWITPSNKKYFATTSPSTGRKLSEVAEGSKKRRRYRSEGGPCCIQRRMG